MRLIFSDEAERDLEGIGDYIAEDSPVRAISFSNELRAACNGLLESPLRFASLEGLESKGFRRRIHGRYAIVYTIKTQDVLIVRILSVAMDLKSILSDSH
jgi:toxin ParE1/3/4